MTTKEESPRSLPPTRTRPRGAVALGAGTLPGFRTTHGADRPFRLKVYDAVALVGMMALVSVFLADLWAPFFSIREPYSSCLAPLCLLLFVARQGPWHYFVLATLFFLPLAFVSALLHLFDLAPQPAIQFAVLLASWGSGFFLLTLWRVPRGRPARPQRSMVEWILRIPAPSDPLEQVFE